MSEGRRFDDEKSEMFGVQDHIRSINYDNTKTAENIANNGFSIWEPEFDELEAAFKQSQETESAKFVRRSAAEKQALANKSWEYQQLNQIRQAKVLPYRGLGISRLASEQPIQHGKIGSVNEFYAEAQDSIRDMIRQSNDERKSKIQRQGVDPTERRSEWENKEAIAARTMEALNNTSFLANFAEAIHLND